LADLGVEPAAGEEEVDLGFLARGWVLQADGDPDRGPQAVRPLRADVAIAAGPAHGELVVVVEALVEDAQADLADPRGEVVAVAVHRAHRLPRRQRPGDLTDRAQPKRRHRK
jgi:hypothetical protein